MITGNGGKTAKTGKPRVTHTYPFYQVQSAASRGKILIFQREMVYIYHRRFNHSTSQQPSTIGSIIQHPVVQTRHQKASRCKIPIATIDPRVLSTRTHLIRIMRPPRKNRNSAWPVLDRGRRGRGYVRIQRVVKGWRDETCWARGFGDVVR